MIDPRVPERDAHRAEDMPSNEEVGFAVAVVPDPACSRYSAAANNPGDLGKYAHMAVSIAREHLFRTKVAE
jgi:hypothetical protein